jgi:hypothetical protein
VPDEAAFSLTPTTPVESITKVVFSDPRVGRVDKFKAEDDIAPTRCIVPLPVIFRLVSFEPMVKVTPPAVSPLTEPFCSNIISTLAIPSPIYTSAVPSPIRISPTALVRTKSSPNCSIFPASVPEEFLN